MFKILVMIILAGVYVIPPIVRLIKNSIARDRLQESMFRLTFGEINNEEVKKYMAYVMKVKVRNDLGELADLRGYFNMINDDENVDIELKTQLKNVYETKGIDIGYYRLTNN